LPPKRRGKPQRRTQPPRILARQVPLTVSAIGLRGDGIARHNGQAVHLPKTAVGDQLTADLLVGSGGVLVADAVTLTTPSPDRRAPPCAAYAHCGGCGLQHLSDSAYVQTGRDLLTAALAREGVADLAVVDGHRAGQGQRRRADFAVLHSKGRAQVAFHRTRAHQLVAAEPCLVVQPGLLTAAQALLDGLGQATRGITGVFVQRWDTQTEALITLPDGDPDLEFRLSVPDAVTAAGLHVLHWTDGKRAPEPLAAEAPLTRRFGGTLVTGAPGGFQQATDGAEALMRRLTAQALADAPQTARVVDLFSGLGTLSLGLGAPAPRLVDVVLPIRVEGEAVQLDQRNLFRDPLPAGAFAADDLVIVDPPRAGAEAQSHALAASPVRRIVMISCRPRSFARDLKILMDAGFRPGPIQLIDQFLWSGQLECAAILTRG